MAEPIVINAETREITVPESERSFGVAGEHNVARKHFRINGRIVDGNDLAVGFAWKVCTENSAKQPNEYPIDSIIADSDGIEFDWLVGKGASHTKAASSLRSAPSRSTARARYSTSGTVASERARSTTASRPAPRISAGLTSEPTSSRPLPKSGGRCRTRRPALKMQRRRPAMQTRLQSLPPTTLRPPRNRQTMQQLPPKRLAMRQLRLSRRA